MIIRKENLTDYINFLHQKRKGINAPQELLDHWGQVHESNIPDELNNLYQFWNLTPNQIMEFESEFQNKINASFANIQSDFTPYTPTKSETIFSQNLYNHQPSHVQSPPPITFSQKKKNNLVPILLGALILLVLSFIGYLAYNHYLDSSKENEETVVKNNNSISTKNNSPQSQSNSLKDEVQKPQIDSSNVINEEDKKAKIRTIQSLLTAEENRDFNEIMRHFSPNIQLYWSYKNPSRAKMYELYESTWSKAIDITYKNVSIQRISNELYEMTAEYSFYSLKDDDIKTFQIKNRYEFDKDGKIIKAYGSSNK